MPSSPDLVAPDRRRRTDALLETQLTMLVAVVPIGLALLPDQTAVSRAAWVLLSLTVATAFGAIGERRRQKRLVMRNAFAMAIVAFGVLAGLMIRESAPAGFAAMTSNESATLERDAVPTAPEASVQGATVSAEEELAKCEDALRATSRAISRVTVPQTAPTVPAADDRSIADRRAACDDLIAFIDAAVQQSGALDR